MILPSGALFDVRSLPRVATVNFFLNVLNVFLSPPKMKALRSYVLTSTEEENFDSLPGRISAEFALASQTAIKLFRSSNGREYGQIYNFVCHNCTLKVADCGVLHLRRPPRGQAGRHQGLAELGKEPD